MAAREGAPSGAARMTEQANGWPRDGGESSAVTLDMRDGTARISIDRAPVNAFTLDMVEQLRAIMDRMSNDGTPVLLTGANGVFSAGFDTKQPNIDSDFPRTAALRCVAAVRDHPGPVVAAVEGAAVGLGLLLATSADILVISRAARLRMPEVLLGIVSDMDPLRRFLPEPWIRRMCLLGETFTAADIQLDAMGATLCQPGECERTAVSVIDSITPIKPASLQATKRRLIRSIA
jgi:enoyl-CoA hydratase